MSRSTLDELEFYDVVVSGKAKNAFPKLPEPDFPLQTIVLNVTNQCNFLADIATNTAKTRLQTRKTNRSI